LVYDCKKIHYRISTDNDLKCRIGLITNLNGFVPDNGVLQMLVHESADIIAIAGDIVYGHRLFSAEMLFFLDCCQSITQVYMSLGNHDYVLSQEEYNKIKETGVIILDNHHLEIKPSEYIGGFTSANVLKARLYCVEKQAIVESNLIFLKNFNSLVGFKTLLDHHPEDYQLYTRYSSIDLFFLAHACGVR